MASKKLRFEAELIEGHKGVTAVIVPFNPETVWGTKPIKLDPRRDGWLVKGTANGERFEGYIGNRWGRFFIMLDAEVRKAAGLEPGAMVSMMIEPAATARVLEKAREQSKITTAPRKGRADALEPRAGAARSPRARR